MTLNDYTKKVLKEFRSKVNEVKNDDDFDKNGESEMHEFGMHCVQGNLMYKVIDFGNIEKFISKALKERDEVIVGKLKDEMLDLDLVQDLGLDSAICGAKGFNMGLNKAIEVIQSDKEGKV